MSDEKLPAKKPRKKVAVPTRIIQDNDITQAVYVLPVASKRILQMCFALLADGEAPDGVCDITVANYKKIFKGTSTAQISRDVQSGIITLLTSGVILRDPSLPRSKWVGFPWTEFIEGDGVKDGWGRYKITLNKRVLPYVVGLKEKFTFYDISDCKKFKSTNQIRLYESLCQFRKSGIWITNADHFRDEYELSDTLRSNAAALKRSFIVPTIEKINKDTPLFVIFKDEGGRFTFHIFDDDKAKQAKIRARAMPIEGAKDE